MDQRMNGYDEYQSFYQDSGYGYDQNQGCSMNHQDGSYGYEQQQGYYTDNQGGYHHQQWNNNHQDPYCSSFQQQSPLTEELLELTEKTRVLNETMDRILESSQREMEEGVLSDVDEVLETPKEEEMVSSSSTSKATHEAHCEVTNRSHIDEPKLEENERFLEDFAKRLTPSNDQGCANEEGCAKDDSNEQASKTWVDPRRDRSKIKESLEVLLESEDARGFYSKLDHLQLLLYNKEILGDLLQEVVEEQQSIYLRKMYEYREASSIEKKETIRTMDVPQVEHEFPRHFMPSVFEVVEPLEKLQPLKNAKRKRRKRRKKKKKTKEKVIIPKPLLLTFTPLRFVDGKLECKVSSKDGHKPFSKVKILLSPGSKGDDWSAINEAMVKTFSMKLGDRGPLSKPKVPNG